MEKKNYIDEKGNYINVENLPLIEIFNRGKVEGYKKGFIQGSMSKSESGDTQGEYVDISKLRLMTVEECAGHTIDYAMGWKACIEWIKGGAE